MSIPSLPESEVNWLYGIDKKYKIKLRHEINTVYPVDILPPKLREFVKRQNISTDYVNMGPVMGTSDGMEWHIWGWKALPMKSSSENADWEIMILAKRDPPSMEDLQKKIKQIQSDVGELSVLLKHYSASV